MVTNMRKLTALRSVERKFGFLGSMPRTCEMMCCMVVGELRVRVKM